MISIKEFRKEHEQELYNLVVQLAQIPAPSGKEQKRAEFCCEWLRANGADSAFIDEVGNVVYLYNEKNGQTENNDPLIAFMAHMDVVFPDEGLLPLYEKDGKIFCPGVGDNSANLANMLMCAKYVAENHPSVKCDLLFVCDVGEEGLGNLRGVRKICEQYGNRICAFYAFDLYIEKYTAKAVGSLRYNFQVKTQGGHSYGDFGRPNAIAILAQLLTKLYEIQVPERGKTTYNVGMISGGTSVNTIAPSAEALFEIRSDDAEDLEEMRQRVFGIIEEFQGDSFSADITVNCIGERPCEKNVDVRARQQLFVLVEKVIEQITGERPAPVPCSTDCNIPLSMGIPSVCVGTCRGSGAHTREEYIEKDSLGTGLEIALNLLSEYII